MSDAAEPKWTLKNSSNAAEVISWCLDSIFNMLQKIFDCIEKDMLSLKYKCPYDTSVLGFSTRGGDCAKFLDDLNFSSMIVEYTIAMGAVIALDYNGTIQSATINLESTGELVISGQKITTINMTHINMCSEALAAKEAAGSAVNTGVTVTVYSAMALAIAGGTVGAFLAPKTTAKEQL